VSDSSSAPARTAALPGTIWEPGLFFCQSRNYLDGRKDHLAMNVLKGPHSVVFRVASWFFLIALSCDAVNLDDLFSPSVVLHDDIDIVASNIHSDAESVVRIFPTQHRVLVPLRVVRLMIDQDSPALSADTIQSPFNLLALLKDKSIALPHPEIPSELLHLRNHALLI
jgi:hypothetical protein